MSLLAPLLGGAFGVIVGAISTPNATVALGLGVFFALIGWALTGFPTGSESNTESESRSLQGLTTPKPSTRVEPTSATLSQPPSVTAAAPEDPRAERQWFWFKVKATLLISAVLVAFNYKRCTETPEERYQKDQYMSDRIKAISSQEAYSECMAEGESDSACRDSARRAHEMAERKANAILGK